MSCLKKQLFMGLIAAYSMFVLVFTPVFDAKSEFKESEIGIPVAAERLFNEYVSLEKAFDVRLADLYSDTAMIKSTRKFSDGHTETLHIPPQRYKAMIRQLMPMAQAVNDRGDYSNVEFAALDDGRVRIHATRYAINKNYSAPVILLVGPDNQGKWVILEEYSETQP